MDKNHISNHICNNNHKRMDRCYQGRLDGDIVLRREDGYDCEGNELHNHLEYYENNEHPFCNKCELKCKNEHGGEIYFLNVEKCANKNSNFRESIWTGSYLQMTLMSLSPSCDVGVEVHNDADQYIRVEHGYACVVYGCDHNFLNNKKKIGKGDAVLIPAGTWHNVINIGRCELKLSSVYAPPHHPKCTVEKHK